jgi:hypothetical protein
VEYVVDDYGDTTHEGFMLLPVPELPECSQHTNRTHQYFDINKFEAKLL